MREDRKEKDLSEIALDVFKSDTQILEESKLYDAFQAFLSVWNVPGTGDATFIFTLVEQYLKRALEQVENASQQSGTTFQVNPVEFLSKIIEKIEFVKKNIKTGQKYKAEDGEIMQEIPIKVSTNIAVEFSNAIIGALQDS